MKRLYNFLYSLVAAMKRGLHMTQITLLFMAGTLLFILFLGLVHAQVSSIGSSTEDDRSINQRFAEGEPTIKDIIANNNGEDISDSQDNIEDDSLDQGGNWLSQPDTREIEDIAPEETTLEDDTFEPEISDQIDNQPTQERPAGPFNDIQGHPYQQSIAYLQEQGIVKGYPDGTFGPERQLTRAEMMKIVLLAALGEEPDNYANCFIDVRTEWFAPYVCYGEKEDIVGGYPSGGFGPNNEVTIAEGAKIALESFDKGINEGNGRNRYQPYIDYLHNNGIFSRYNIYPDSEMTRAEMAYLTHQLLLERQNRGTIDGDRENESIGCGQNPPSRAPSSIYARGIKRSLITDVGDRYNENKPTPLIIAFHGRTNDNRQVQRYYNIDDAADGEAIIVYPLGLPEGGPSRYWSEGGYASDDLRDFALFDNIVEKFSEEYCIDKDRIYVMGHSLGAWFSNSLACSRGDVIRAIGTVGGGTTINTCEGPVAAMIMHNPEDRLAGFVSGQIARDQLVRQNRCGPETKPVGPSWANCVEYTNCLDDAPVVRCPHSDSTAYNGSYYPHTRPNDAAEMIWEFFKENG